MDVLLAAATTYDQLADAGNTNVTRDQFLQLVDSHYPEIIAYLNGAGGTGAKDIWQSVDKMLTFAGSVSDALSNDKLKKALGVGN